LNTRSWQSHQRGTDAIERTRNVRSISVSLSPAALREPSSGRSAAQAVPH
jgi:hypothetical protein